MDFLAQNFQSLGKGSNCGNYSELRTNRRRDCEKVEQLFSDTMEESVVNMCKKAIEEIYQIHRKTQLSKLPELFQKHAGKEIDFYLSVCGRFGVTPDSRLASAERPKDAQRVTDPPLHIPSRVTCPPPRQLIFN